MRQHLYKNCGLNHGMALYKRLCHRHVLSSVPDIQQTKQHHSTAIMLGSKLYAKCPSPIRRTSAPVPASYTVRQGALPTACPCSARISTSSDSAQRPPALQGEANSLPAPAPHTLAGPGMPGWLINAFGMPHKRPAQAAARAQLPASAWA